MYSDWLYYLCTPLLLLLVLRILRGSTTSYNELHRSDTDHTYTQAQISQVRAILPHIAVDEIVEELRATGNIEETIGNLLGRQHRARERSQTYSNENVHGAVKDFETLDHFPYSKWFVIGPRSIL